MKKCVFVCRCYSRALKRMPEVPSLWHDLGFNFYRQSCITPPAEGDQNCQSLLLEKAQEVTARNIFSLV